MNKFSVAVAALCAAAVGTVVGCGGGSGTSAPSGAAKSLSVGEASITYTGELKPAVAVSSNGVTVEGMAGASVSQFSLIPTQELKNSLIAYSVGEHLQTLYAGQTSVITGATNAIGLWPTFTNDGRIIFPGFDATHTASDAIYACRYDGSSLTRLFGSTHVDSHIGWFSSGNEVVYSDHTHVYLNNLAGTAETTLTTGDQPAVSPTGTMIAYQLSVSGKTQIFLIPVGGGTPVQVTNSTTVNYAYPEFSPDGNWVVYEADNGTQVGLEYADVNNPAEVVDFAPQDPTGSMTFPNWSPDGKFLIYSYSADYPAGSDNALYYQSSAYGSQAFLAVGQNEVNTLIGTWSPFMQKKTFVGSGGSMFTSASGFLWTETQGAMESVLAFTATTPSKASVTPETVNGSTSQIMHLSADSITGLKFTNSYYAGALNIIPGSQSAVSDVLVSIDGTVGTIDTIAPYVETRAATAPVKSLHGANLVYSGKFLGVWNKGKNLAPNGASQVVLNPKSGKLVSFS